MWLWKRRMAGIVAFTLLCGWAAAQSRTTPGPPAPARRTNPNAVVFTVVDENGLAISGAQIVLQEKGEPAVHLTTDYGGHASWLPPEAGTYSVEAARPGFYETSASGFSTSDKSVRLQMTHEQVIRQQVNVEASEPGIDPEEIANTEMLNTPEIVNLPYPTNRDIRNILPFNPGVVASDTEQIHVAGAETWMTLDTLDGFDIRSPVFGQFDLRVSPDAVRSIDTEFTRYPVEYGNATGGVVAFSTGMGDNKFRYDATNFLPSFRLQNGLRFDTLEPRITFSGPIAKNRAWFFNAFDIQYTSSYVPGLPSNADTNELVRGGELFKAQTNLGNRNSLTTALFYNDYHSPYENLSVLNPQQSTENHDVIGILPWVRDQQSFRNGVMLDSGFGVMSYHEGFEPHGDAPYVLTPEQATGSDFDNLLIRSLRYQGYGNFYFPVWKWEGSHQIRAGFNVERTGFTGNDELAPVNYVGEGTGTATGPLVRRSVYPAFPSFALHNLALGSYIEDRWTPRAGLLIDPGLRFDWNEIIRKAEFSPRIAMNFSPPGAANTTQFSAGIGLYYGHTQLEDLARAHTGIRYDTYYAADGVTPLGPPELTTFTANDDLLHAPRAVNWSVGVQHKLPWDVISGLNFMQKRTSDIFVYANQDGTGAQPGNYLLTNNRTDHYHSIEVQGRKTFRGGYTLFASYTHSSATTNAALDYSPAIDVLTPQLSSLPAISGVQQSGPLPWDVPNRVISWGWLPAWAPFFPSVHKDWDFVYSFLWNTGFPFDSVNPAQEIVGQAGDHRYPDYLDFSPGLEWRFHFGGRYFAIRGMMENATGSRNWYIVNNDVASPQYLTFSQPLGRAFTARIRLIQSSK